MRSRTTAISALRERVASLEAQLVAQHQRYDALVQELLALKRDGFVPYQPQPEMVTAAEPLPPKVEKAILARSVEGTPEYQHLVRHARQQLAWEANPDEVADLILKGSADELEVAV